MGSANDGGAVGAIVIVGLAVVFTVVGLAVVFAAVGITVAFVKDGFSVALTDGHISGLHSPHSAGYSSAIR